VWKQLDNDFISSFLTLADGGVRLLVIFYNRSQYQDLRGGSASEAKPRSQPSILATVGHIRGRQSPKKE
jgi:hypothetical protein